MSDYRKDTNKKKEKEKKYFYIYVPETVYFCLNLFMSCTYAFIPDSTRQIGMFAF